MNMSNTLTGYQIECISVLLDDDSVNTTASTVVIPTTPEPATLEAI